ncbi:hypothetical protein B0H17DRAFT_1128211 [Mycena rosella]|uniref:Uncharacterized protein n=1 Tax=Mycena rosella TaxID=1033263 RepID=A0AAD7DZ56_MYCRO|nr:hypothetical protein B0H17DRAFT_1128211 [Mycena rosella]
MSPLSNNALSLTYEQNPLPDFFNTGLNVTLSTDRFHFTKEPLEKYSVTAHIYKFPQSLLAELARNPVIQSGFEMETNVPNIRLAYRHQTLMEELNMISAKATVGKGPESPENLMTVMLPTLEALTACAMAPTKQKYNIC